MPFQPPPGVPVPIVSVAELGGWKFGIWYAYNGTAMVCVAAVFAKAPNATDYSIAVSLMINQTPEQNKQIVDNEWDNDEVKVINAHLVELNKKFDEWLRSQFDWENVGSLTLKSETEIDAMPDGYSQLNWTLASRFAFVVNAAQKKIDIVQAT